MILLKHILQLTRLKQSLSLLPNLTQNMFAIAASVAERSRPVFPDEVSAVAK